MEIYPVVRIVEAEFAESDDRLFGSNVQQDAIALSVSFGQRAGIESQQDACPSLAVGKVHRQFGVFVAYFPCQYAAESKLRVAGAVDDSALQLHACGVLADGKEHGVQLQRIGVQPMDGRAAVDAPVGREAKAQGEVVVPDAFGLQQVADGVLTSGFQLHACRWQRAAQLGMVQLPVVYLLHQEVGKQGALFHQSLQCAAGAEAEVHVAGCQPYFHRVVPGFCPQPEAEGVFQGFGRYAQAVQVDVVHVHVQCAVQVGAVQPQGSVPLHLQQVVPAGQADGSHRCVQSGFDPDAAQVPMPVLQFLERGFQGGSRMWRSKVCAFALGFQLCGQQVDGVVGQKVVYLQAVDGKVGMVSFVGKVVVGIQSQEALLFVHLEGGCDTWSLHAQLRVEPHAVGHGERGRVAGKAGQEVQVARAHPQVHVPVAPDTVVQVPEFPAAVYRKRSGQVDVEARYLHLLQVAFRAGAEDEWVHGVVFLERLGQVAGQEHHVLLADAGIKPGAQVSCGGNVNQFPIGLCAEVYLAVRGGQPQGGDAYQG